MHLKMSDGILVYAPDNINSMFKCARNILNRLLVIY